MILNTEALVKKRKRDAWIFFKIFITNFSVSIVAAENKVFILFRLENYLNFWIMECTLFCLYMKCRRGNKHFEVYLGRIRTVHFLSDGRRAASWEGRNWLTNVFHSRQNRLFRLDISQLKYFSLLKLWIGVYIIIFSAKENTKKRTESTKLDQKNVLRPWNGYRIPSKTS